MSDTKLIEFLSGIAIIVPHADEEAMQVDVVDPEERAIYCTGEESGEQYYIGFDEFNPDDFMFYKLQLVEFPK
jgi:hypothetical protein